ncbi:hypothetical protein GCM10010387_29260 [Streptomyces inusitatus]|uniref:Uncharacterized protein n=1 Tax=Streptomyces inusitatus TaxID=68221 RepID=A0A918Q4A9_9ACTN|nr:hypothetical protein [Streptomyces inusitatus]GGZ33270.1 hypothetical protein GCM10010387_29260 [Streptomyces inusitatus]
MTTDLPIGDLRFYDNQVPALAAGNWQINLTHTLKDITTGTMGATQNLVVSAPQFAMDPALILNRYPPADSTGPYDTVLPHIVLNDALLPWERTMTNTADANRTPWLALLVLGEDEIIGGSTSPTRTQTDTVSGFLAADPAVLKPAVTREDDVALADPCTFIQLPADLFARLIPRLDELRFLTHCRESHIGDKAEQGLETDGLFSAVIANRFPAAPATGTEAQKSIVHLVSLEGLEPYLVDQPAFTKGISSVALVSLASWTFHTTPDNPQDFRGLAANLVGQEYATGTCDPEKLWLRLPELWGYLGTQAGSEVFQRVTEGFVPLGYRLRTGEETLAWYRGPCAPVRTTPPPATGRTPWASADAALIYHEEFGVFDASLATAWQAGRSLALADRAFAQALHDFRRRAHQLADRLQQQLNSDAFTVSRTAGLTTDARAQDTFLPQLSTALLTDLNTSTAITPVTTPPIAPATLTQAVPVNPVRAAQDFLADPQVRGVITATSQEDLAPVAAWLARLRLLYALPFNLLVPDERMLPPESLRFFLLDENWLTALTDGALSVAVQSTRDTHLNQVMDDTVQQATRAAAQTVRAQKTGVTTSSTPSAAGEPVSGFLLRSALVSGWPNLAVRGTRTDDSLLPLLRMDHLAPDLLLCLFDGVPDTVEFSEPQEGFRFGVDDDGRLPLRQPTTGTPSRPIGTQLPGTGMTLGSLRAGGHHVLDITSAVTAVQNALAAVNAPVTGFGPGDFALQMVKSPEAVRFTSQAS